MGADFDVLIVGAGPSGLTMAIECERMGLRYELIDEHEGPARWSQALVVQARTLEQFERYTVAEHAVAVGQHVAHVALVNEGNPLPVMRFDGIPGKYPYSLFLPQSETEQVLLQHLAGYGREVKRRSKLRDISEHEDAIEATVESADGSKRSIRAEFLIACDGAHSTAREALNMPFLGRKVEMNFFLADCKLQGEDIPQQEIRVYLHRGEFVFMAPVSNELTRIIACTHPVSGDMNRALTDEEMRIQIDRCSLGRAQFDIVETVWRAPFHVNERKIAHFRAGRVFFVGDAAHIHSPVFGQGMNTGIQDAANLAWKLAAVKRGGNARLLDSYDAERGAVASRLLATTSNALAAISDTHAITPFLRSIVGHLLPALPPLRNKLGNFLSETDIQYRQSSVVIDAGGAGLLQAGDRAPDGILSDGRILLAPMQSGGKHLIIDTAQSFLLDGEGRGHYGSSTRYGIRPDGYIGFRGRLEDEEAWSAYEHLIGHDTLADAAHITLTKTRAR